MKRLLLISIVVTLLMATQTMAATVWVERGPVRGTNGGGQFLLTLSGDLVLNGNVIATSGKTFISFCLEEMEAISYDQSYTAIVNPDEAAVWGGTLGGADVISEGTAYLFNKYNDTITTSQQATDLQAAIWYLEDEISLADPTANAYLNELTASFGSINIAKTTNANLGDYNLYVLNLTTETGARAQDQLVHVPDGGLTILLLGLGIGSMALLYRKVKV
jgi:hypothetical protein